MKKTIPSLSGDASLLISYFAGKPVGYEVSWEDLHKLIDRDPRPLMTTVRNRLIREYYKVLVTIWGVGVRVASDTEVVKDVAPQQRRRAHMAARKAQKALGTVEVDNLPEQERKAFFREMSLAGVVAAATTQKAVKKLETYESTDSPQLVLARTLEALKNH